MWDVHHVIMDASSRNILTREIRQILEGARIKRETGAFSCSIYYPPETIWKSEEFFDGMLSGYDNESGLISDISGSFGVSEKMLPCNPEQITGFASSLGITAGDLFIAAFAYTLSRFTGRSDSVFNITDTGRISSETAGSIGMFVRTLPLRIDCSDRKSSAFLKEVSSVHLDSMSNGIIPYGKLAKKYGVSLSVLFEYNAGINRAFQSESSSFEADAPSGSGIVSDIQCVISDKEDGYCVSLFHSDKFSCGTAELMTDAYCRIVSGLIEKENLSDIIYTSGNDVLRSESVNANGKEIKYLDILKAFADNVPLYRDRPLVSFKDISITYGEADSITDGIAYR
ncbi:MAG: hypothetical protein J5494_01660, partial [Candidatus Methanomethylophilaceae archaeon]|nr:hypothetical protein [Candidatus Methanomethylophilaceae archaeon]